MENQNCKSNIPTNFTSNADLLINGSRLPITQTTQDDIKEFQDFKRKMANQVESDQQNDQKSNIDKQENKLIQSEQSDTSSQSGDKNEEELVAEDSDGNESQDDNQEQCLQKLQSKYQTQEEVKESKMNADNVYIKNGTTESCNKIEPETDRQQTQEIKSSQHQNLNNLKKKKKKKVNKKKLIMHVAFTKYYVVRYVAKNIFKMRLTCNEDEDWDISWMDGSVSCDKLYKMKPYQRINHFPGMYALARKNHLARNLAKMQKAFPEDYKFFPKTFLLPSEYPEFRNQFQKKKKANKTFIVKPEASCQGRGIFMTRSLDDVNPYDHFVIQRYLHKPYLIENLKFDLRIYVFLCGVEPLRVYMYQEGLSRFATEPYAPPNHNNLENLYMHLTNYAINKSSGKFIFNKADDNDSTGHKRSYTFVLRYLQEQGHDIEKVQNDLKSTIIKTICAVQPSLSHIYRSCQPDDLDNSMCFELLGFDIFLDSDLKPWIIEVNHSPSFATDTPLDFKIKKNLIADTIQLLNLSYQKKQLYKKQKTLEFQKRAIKGKPKITLEEKEQLKNKKIKKRDIQEKKNIGSFDLIFPSEQNQYEDYQKYMNIAKQNFEDFNQGSNRVKKDSNNTSTTPQQERQDSFTYHKQQQSSFSKPQNPRPQTVGKEQEPRKNTVLVKRNASVKDIKESSHLSTQGKSKTECFIENVDSDNDQNKVVSKPKLVCRPPSGRLKLQLDPNFAEFNQNNNNKNQIYQNSKKRPLTSNVKNNLKSPQNSSGTVIVQDHYNTKQSNHPSINSEVLLQVQKNSNNQASDSNSNRNNEEENKNNTNKNLFSVQQQYQQSKPKLENTFEKFIQNLQKTNSIGRPSQENTNSSHNLHGIQQKNSFQNDIQLNIKSINHSGLLQDKNSSQLIRDSQQNMERYVQKKRRIASQNRISSAKVPSSLGRDNVKGSSDQFIGGLAKVLLTNSQKDDRQLIPYRTSMQKQQNQQWLASQNAYNPRLQYPQFKYSSTQQANIDQPPAQQKIINNNIDDNNLQMQLNGQQISMQQQYMSGVNSRVGK